MKLEKRNVIVCLLYYDAPFVKELTEEEAQEEYLKIKRTLKTEYNENIVFSYKSWKQSGFLLPCYFEASHKLRYRNSKEIKEEMKTWRRNVFSFIKNKNLAHMSIRYKTCSKCAYINESHRNYFPCKICGVKTCYNTNLNRKDN